MRTLLSVFLAVAVNMATTGVVMAGTNTEEAPRYPAGDDPDAAIEMMRRLPQGELDSLYMQAEAGPVPSGDSKGTAVFFPANPMDRMMQRLASLVWQGKVFDSEEPFLMNKVLGFNAVKAKVYPGESLLDGGPSIIIDYKDTSLMFRQIRDEIRIVAPNVYLGRAYLRSWVGDYMAVNFILNFN